VNRIEESMLYLVNKKWSWVIGNMKNFLIESTICDYLCSFILWLNNDSQNAFNPL